MIIDNEIIGLIASVNTILLIFAATIFAIACHQNKKLFPWLFLYITFIIGNFFYLNQFVDYIYQLIANLMYIVTIFCVLIAAFLEYNELFIKSNRSKLQKIKVITTAIVLSPIITSIYVIMVLLLIIPMIMLVRIYIKTRSTTKLLFLACCITAAIGVSLQAIPYYSAGLGMFLTNIFSTVYITILLINGIVANIEEKLKITELKYYQAYYQTEFYKDIFVHDISNILQIIFTSAEIFDVHLKDQQTHEDTKKCLNIIKAQVKRGSGLVKNVRILSELSNKMQILSKINLFNIVERMCENVKSISLEKDVKIQLQVNNNNREFFVLANDYTYDMIENIVLNAISHNNNESIEVTISLLKEQMNNYNFIKIIITDNGIGITDVMKESLFKNETKNTKKLSRIGLGLLLVKELLNIYHAEIKIEDRINGDYSKGSKFIITFPEAE